LKRGSAAIVGEGRNIWNEVNLDDISQFYVKLLEGVVDSDTSSSTVQKIKKYHGKEGYYFVENGEHTLHCVSAKIGEILHKKGLVDSSTPKPLTDDEVKEYFDGEWFLGTNARCRGLKAREIGWVPERTTEDMLKGIEAEVDALLARKD
jgi:nucleoside-diphosphate-sugar epimerase